MITQRLKSLIRIKVAAICGVLMALTLFVTATTAPAAPTSPSPVPHDHSESNAASATGDSGRNAMSLTSAVRFAGKFHVLIIHFPIALLVLASLTDSLYLILRNQSFAFTSGVCLYVGAPAAVVAASLGWAVASTGTYTEALQHIVETHRWLGTVTAAWAVMAAVFNVLSLRNSHFAIAAAYRVFLYGGAVLVGVTAHFGGSLIYGADYLTR